MKPAKYYINMADDVFIFREIAHEPDYVHAELLFTTSKSIKSADFQEFPDGSLGVQTTRWDGHFEEPSGIADKKFILQTMGIMGI